jgi:hypothetical protein
MFFKVVGRITARLFRSIGKFLYLSFRNARKHPYGTVFSLLLTAAVIYILYATSIFGLAGPSNSANATVITAVENTTEPDGKSNEFLVALKDANAGTMYNSLNDDYHKLLKQRGITDARAMQDQINKKLQELTGQANGRVKYTFTFAGGARFSDGSVENDFSGTTETQGQRASVTVIIKLKDSKISDVRTDEPVILAALGTNKDASGGDAQLGVVGNNRSPVAEDFMKGLTTFDVDKIWNSLADSYKAQLTAKGVNRDTMAQIFDQIKSDNASTGKGSTVVSYDGYAYLNTINFPNGISVNQFISILSVGDNPRQPAYSIVLDNTNKIIRLGNDQAQDPIFGAILGRSQTQG